MFYLSADKSKLNVLEKGIITSGAINAYNAEFRFSPEWDGMERVAVFRVGAECVSRVLDKENKCKIPWECTRENDIGKELLVGVYGMIGTEVVLPTIWSSLGLIKEGTRLGETALPPTPSVAEQILAEILAARDSAISAAERAEAAAGIIPPPEDENPDDGETPDTGDDSPNDTGTNDEIATDDEVNDTIDGIFGN